MTVSKVARPHAEVLALAELLVAELASSCMRVEIAGSLRRRKPVVGDIELVAIPKLERRALDEQPSLFAGGERAPKVEETNLLWQRLDRVISAAIFTKRGEKYRQFPWRGVQVDLFTCDRQNFGWCWLVRTGSADFSRHIATQLNRYGYTSREGWIGLNRGPWRPLVTPDEEEVFRLAQEPYVAPERRSW